MFVPNSNIEGNISTYVFGNCSWHFRELKKDCWNLSHLLSKN